jgi:endonuclease/exonuclease/phosphatase family metal-dependent hydrolase
MLRRAVAIASTTVVLLALASVGTWAVGFLATDRWRWSQYPWWFPWFGYAAIALPALIVAWRARMPWRRRLARVAGAGTFLLVAIGLWRDVGLPRAASARPSLAIVQWNASWVSAKAGARPSQELRDLDPDVVLVSNPFRLFTKERTEAWRAAGYDVRQFGSFAVASRVPIVDARLLFNNGRMGAVSCTIDATASLGRAVTITILDLPSNPREARVAVVEECLALLESAQAPPADIVAGDLNITRGSYSLTLLAPDRRDAWTEGGVGWGASWPRPLPFLQLDHVLIAPWLSAHETRFVDLDTESHLAQRVTLVAQEP